jgi:PIN domain nuclease of toxin-antitoxin system
MHTLIWWLVEPKRLPETVHGVMRDTQDRIFVSAASAMEMAIKHRIGKLPIVESFINDLSEVVKGAGFDLLAIQFDDAVKSGQLKFNNRDPFDRLLIAQAINQNLILISNEVEFDSTGVTRLWL